MPLNISAADAPIVKSLIESEHLTKGINVHHLRVVGLEFLEAPIITPKGDDYLQTLERRENEASSSEKSQKQLDRPAHTTHKKTRTQSNTPRSNTKSIQTLNQKLIAWLKLWHRPVVLLAAATVIIGYLGFLYVRRQTEIMETINQPHLVTADATFHYIEIGKRPYFTMKIQNTGPLPALAVDVQYRLQIGDVGFFHSLGNYPSAERSLENIGAGKEISITLRPRDSDPPLTETIVTELRGTGLKNIKAHGRIGYESDLVSEDTRTKIWAYIRLTTKGKRIQTPFCYEYDPRENGAVICNTGVFDDGK